MNAKLKPGTMFADRYQILECLGRGGMGTVYSAQHVALAKKFAIKLLHRDLCVNNNALKRFAQEARSASGIEHQNIIDVLDAGRIDDTAFYVMEHLKGEDLQTTFRRESPLPWDRIQRITLQICDAMQAAHDRRIIHRDLKPSNLYRITRGTNLDFIKILDFGIAKVRTTDDMTRDGLTAVGSILGTLKYMAPEQAKGLKVDHRADIYSLGVIMYHGLTGELPFRGSQPADLIQKLLHEAPTPMREYVENIPFGVEPIVLKALSKDPSERFPSMHSLASVIARLKPVEPPSPRRVTHSRGPMIELDDSSIELVSEAPTPGLTTDITTFVRAPKHARAKKDELVAWTRRPPSRPTAGAQPRTPKVIARSTDEIATQTGSPRVPRVINRQYRMLTPWIPGVAVAGFMLFQNQNSAPAPAPVLAPTPDLVQNYLPQSPSALPMPPPITQEQLPAPPPEQPVAKGADPALRSTEIDQGGGVSTLKPKKPKRVKEAPGNCSIIQEQTLAAEKAHLWAELYLYAKNECWRGDPRARGWQVRAKMQLGKFSDCIALGKTSSDPQIIRWVNLCTRKLEDKISVEP